MKKILLPLIVLSFPSLLQAATAATQLEGGFKVGPAIILITILILFVMVGIVFRAKDTTDFYAAGRGISKVGSGMAIASNWMSAASFLGMAALMYGSGYHGLAYVVGWTGGYVLLLILMAGQIRKYGKYTAADFIGDRYYSKTLRAVGAIIAILISISYCVGQFGGIGLMFKWVMGIEYSWAVVIGGAVVLTYTLISGMLGVTKNMQIQYVIIIISSIMVPNFLMLILIMAFFGWIGITWTMRTVTYKEREREYVLAAKALGASNFRIIFKHIIPNTIAIIVTFAPFAVSGGIVALTSLDYLGFGLPPPTPSWGELLQQGWNNLDAWWISGSVVVAMIVTLITVTFTGEAVREAFDPKLHTTYE